MTDLDPRVFRLRFGAALTAYAAWLLALLVMGLVSAEAPPAAPTPPEQPAAAKAP